jgi:hypothetical protein
MNFDNQDIQELPSNITTNQFVQMVLSAGIRLQAWKKAFTAIFHKETPKHDLYLEEIKVSFPILAFTTVKHYCD